MGLETGAFSAKQYLREGPGMLPLSLTGAFLIGLGVFAYFASTVSHFPGEVSASTWVQSWRASWLDALTKAVSLPGVLAVAVPMVLLASAVLYLRGWRVEGALLLMATIGGHLIGVALKEMISRTRPPDELVQVLQGSDSYSFPSGHVMHYVVFFGTLVFILTMRMNPGVGLRLAQGGFVLGLLAIGLARIYLGAHWLSDVVAGYAFGAAVMVGALWLGSRWMAWSGRSTQARRPGEPATDQVG